MGVERCLPGMHASAVGDVPDNPVHQKGGQQDGQDGKVLVDGAAGWGRRLMPADCRCSGGGLMKGRPAIWYAGLGDYARGRSLFARLAMLMPFGMVVFLAVMVVVMLLAAVGVDGGDLQDDGFVAGLGKVLLAGGVGEDAAGRQGLQFAGVVGVAETQLQGAADDVDEEVAFLGAVRLQFLVGGDLDAQDADVVVVVGVQDGLAGGKVDLLGGEDLVDALGLLGMCVGAVVVLGVVFVGVGRQGQGGQGGGGQQGGDGTDGVHGVLLGRVFWLMPMVAAMLPFSGHVSL